MSTQNVKTLKWGPPIHAAKREVISSSQCLDCGHLISDHHRAGGGWHSGQSMQWKEYGKRDHCIGAGDTCPCRRFRQPHQRAISVVVQGLKR